MKPSPEMKAFVADLRKRYTRDEIRRALKELEKVNIKLEVRVR